MNKRSVRSENLKRAIFIISIIFFLSFIPLVSSAPVKFSGTTTTGIDIEHPYITPYKYGEDIKFHFHIFNSSTGLPILANKLTTNCSFHLYNSSGSHILKVNNIVSSDDILDYEQIVKKGNFTYSGKYAYVFQCNSSTAGGYYTNDFDITPNGDSIDTGTGLIYFLVTLFSFGIFLLISWLFLTINGENPKDETGFLGINYRKYIKCALFPLVYVVFLWFFNFIIGLSNNYLGLTLYANTLGFIFMILTKLVYPIIALCVIIAIVLMIKDSNIEKEYKSLWNNY
jgi:hypothetical protein